LPLAAAEAEPEDEAAEAEADSFFPPQETNASRAAAERARAFIANNFFI
jgi:hypothetical protein